MIEIPAAIQSTFDGRDLASKLSSSAMLSTVDAQGWPHLSFLSAGEVLVQGNRVALTLWAQAHSAQSLDLNRRGVLFAACDGGVCELRLEVATIVPAPAGRTAVVLARADALREHRAPYATVTSLIDFALDDGQATLARWQGQVAAMQDALAAMPPVAAS